MMEMRGEGLRGQRAEGQGYPLVGKDFGVDAEGEDVDEGEDESKDAHDQGHHPVNARAFLFPPSRLTSPW